jgi:hypothetical protein
MTDKQIEVVTKLNTLVGTRHSIESLNVLLSNVFNEQIKVEDITDLDTQPSDYNLLFESTNVDTYGFFDIYYLKMINKGFDDSDMYITEISYEFE